MGGSMDRLVGISVDEFMDRWVYECEHGYIDP